MPDIALFDSQYNKGNPFAKYDYMGVKPVLSHIKGVLRLCDDLRGNGHKIPKSLLTAELRAYTYMKDNDYAVEQYPWINTATDCWYTVII